MRSRENQSPELLFQSHSGRGGPCEDLIFKPGTGPTRRLAREISGETSP